MGPSSLLAPTTGPSAGPTAGATPSGPTSIPSRPTSSIAPTSGVKAGRFVGLFIELVGVTPLTAKSEKRLRKALARAIERCLTKLGIRYFNVEVVILESKMSTNRRLLGGESKVVVKYECEIEYQDSANSVLTENDIGPKLMDNDSERAFVEELQLYENRNQFEALKGITTGWNGEREGKQSESNGDPHFKTWKNEHFEYHGQCDLVMVSKKDFANSLGIDIHIRTKIVRFWSYIQRAAIRIGNDILEVEGSIDMTKVIYWINYEYMGELTDLGGFPVTVNENTDRYTIDLDKLYPGQQIQIKTFKEFVGVKVIGGTEDSFGGSVGIIGDFESGNTYARDGSTVLHDF